MAEERKGAMTPEQQTQLDKVVKFDGFWEVIDGPAITIIDDQAIDRVLAPQTDQTRQVVYEVVDIIFLGIAQMVEANEAAKAAKATKEGPSKQE